MQTFSFPETSHMPFITADGVAFCCLPINGLWKIHALVDGIWQRVYTGQPEDATECAPAAEYDEGEWRISFIAGGSEERTVFRLYRILAPNIPLSPYDWPDIESITPAMVGYSRDSRTVHASRTGPIFINGNGRSSQLEFHDAKFYYRISFHPHNPQMLIISGSLADNAIFTRYFHLVDQTIGSITVNGEPAYKCALWRDQCYFARQTGLNFEDRSIQYGEPEFTPLDTSLFSLRYSGSCIHADDTGEKAFINIPCRGNRIICRRDGHISSEYECSPGKCKYFEPVQSVDI